jgi:hypothetical protein
VNSDLPHKSFATNIIRLNKEKADLTIKKTGTNF